MNVNATFIVQIVNFFIAYLLFRHILLNPGYQLFKEKEMHRASLEDTVEQGKRAVEQEKQKQWDAWKGFWEWCAEYLPAMVDRTAFFRGITISVVSKEISDEQKKVARSQLVKTMISTIKGRYER